MNASSCALRNAARPARFAALLTIAGVALLPWTLTLPNSIFGAWWVLTTWLPALATFTLAPAESIETLRWIRQRCRNPVRGSLGAAARVRRLHVPRAGAGAVRIRLRRPQGVRNHRQAA